MWRFLPYAPPALLMPRVPVTGIMYPNRYPATYGMKVTPVHSERDFIIPRQASYVSSIKTYDQTDMKSKDILKDALTHKNCILKECRNELNETEDYSKHSTYYCVKDQTAIYICGGSHSSYSLNEIDYWMMDQSSQLLSECNCKGKYWKYGSSESVIFRTFKSNGKPTHHIDGMRHEDTFSEGVNAFLKKVNYTEVHPPTINGGMVRINDVNSDITNENSERFNAVDAFWVQTLRNHSWKMEYIDKLCSNNMSFLTCGSAHVKHLVKLLEEDGFEIFPIPVSNDIVVPNDWYVGLTPPN